MRFFDTHRMTGEGSEGGETSNCVSKSRRSRAWNPPRVVWKCSRRERMESGEGGMESLRGEGEYDEGRWEMALAKSGRLLRGDARGMIAYFREEIEAGRIPTFSGAAARLGCTGSELMSACRERKEYTRAYAECRMLLVDYLIEGGLTKRLDGSLVKLMLGELGARELGVVGIGYAGGGSDAGDGAVGGMDVTVRIEGACGSEVSGRNA